MKRSRVCEERNPLLWCTQTVVLWSPTPNPFVAHMIFKLWVI